MSKGGKVVSKGAGKSVGKAPANAAKISGKSNLKSKVASKPVAKPATKAFAKASSDKGAGKLQTKSADKASNKVTPKASIKASAKEVGKPLGKSPSQVKAGAGEKAESKSVEKTKGKAPVPKVVAPKSSTGKESTSRESASKETTEEFDLSADAELLEAEPAPMEALSAAESTPAKAKRETSFEVVVDDAPEEIVLTDAEGRRYCKVKDCDQYASVEDHCRFHYLLLWKRIQVRRKILIDGKLERYVEELTARYPDKFLEMIRKDLRSEKDFLSAIAELEIDESAIENDYEDENSSFIDEVRGMSSESTMTDDDDF